MSIPRVFRFLWSPSGSAIYFTRLNKQLRCSKVMCQKMEDLQKVPTVVYKEPREECFLDISLTKDNVRPLH